MPLDSETRMSIEIPLRSSGPSVTSNARMDAEVGLETVDLTLVKPEPEALGVAPGEFALRTQILPLAFDGETLIVAMGSIASLPAVDDLGILINKPVRAVMADAGLIR